MKIGIDIDDTITNSTKVIKEYAIKYDNEYNNKLACNLFYISRGNFICKEIDNFFTKYANEINEKIEVKEDAQYYINKLKEEGNQIYIITARNNRFYTKTPYEMLDSFNIKYDKILTNKLHKLESCKEEKIDLMIDDSIETCKEINDNNIDVLLFDSIINKDINTNIKRVYNWKDVYNYINKK